MKKAWKQLRIIEIVSATLFLFLVSLNCPPGYDYNRAIAVLIDVSGSYKAYVPEAFDDTGVIIENLDRSDVFFLGIINSLSFKDENIKISQPLPHSISMARKVKRALIDSLQQIERSVRFSDYTDIQGAINLMARNLEKIRARKKKIFLFTDLRETREVKGSYDLSGIEILVLNIPTGDDPEDFEARIHRWNNILNNHQADKLLFLDPAQTNIQLSELLR